MAFPPYRGTDRHNFADYGFRGIRATGYDRLDVIDLDTTGHHHSVPIVCGRSRGVLRAESRSSGNFLSWGNFLCGEASLRPR
ncbi:hypothetical protein MTY59_33010 [Mycobacterium senriense]|uniref:Uncharacterized protein n=1 Tax=Mycobacterium senriense TaxID=2775496 RepID=A0ABM7SQ84_9MYCO|nr:hypothetical protein MTY59_33010 [Mycobacterium senriense]